MYLQKELLFAETPSFGIKCIFLQANSTVGFLQIGSRWRDALQKDTIFGGKTLFWQKEALSAEIHISKLCPFGHRQKEENSVSFDL